MTEKTPEQRAAAIDMPFMAVALLPQRDRERLLASIAAAIREAVEAERERCAKVADRFANAKEMRGGLSDIGVPDHLVSADGFVPVHPLITSTGRQIATEIRRSAAGAGGEGER